MLEENKIYQRTKRNLIKYGLIKAYGYSIGISLIISVILFIALYLMNPKIIYFSAIAFLAIGLILGPIIYLIFYRPKEIEVARIMDSSLALNDRVKTMLELKDDNSFMAKLQREETLEALDKIDSKKLCFNLTKPLLGFVKIFSIAILTITSILVLNFNIVRIEENKILNATVEIRYIETEGGVVLGEKNQVIKLGDSTSEVVALANKGYVFVGWSDGKAQNSRIDENCQESKEIKSIFRKIDSTITGGFTADSTVPNPDDIKNNNNQDVDGNMPGASGEYIENNQVIDGNTYYRDVYKEYLEQALRDLEAGKELSEYLKLIVEDYFQIIK